MVGTHRRSRRRQARLDSSLNLTSLLDVCMVLLLAFMVAGADAASQSQQGVSVDLPDAKAEAIKADANPVVITVTDDNKIFLNETETSMDGLVAGLVQITGGDTETPIHLKGSRELSYQQMMQVMGSVSSAGYSSIALVVGGGG